MPKRTTGQPPKGPRLEVVRGGTEERVGFRAREREAAAFGERVGDVGAVKYDAARGIGGDAPHWAKTILGGKYQPGTFNFVGWQG